MITISKMTFDGNFLNGLTDLLTRSKEPCGQLIKSLRGSELVQVK